MSNQDITPENISAGMSRYGYPVADFNEVTLVISDRPVVVNAILWDAEFGHYRAAGWYAKKDGTAGKQTARPLMFDVEVPAAVLAVLEPLK